MRINILYVFIFSVLLFTACEKKATEGISQSYSLELKGGEQLINQLNSSYVDPGYIATFGGTDVSKEVVIEGKVDTDKVGLYKITYIFQPENGPKIMRSREVIVCDSSVTVDIEGEYQTVEGTHRIRKGAETKYSGQSITIRKIAPGFFEISDFLGGYYAQPPVGYGTAYAASGYVQVKNDNTLTFLSARTLPWGITVTDIEGGIYDPVDSSLYWEAAFAGMVFYVKLNTK